MSFVIDESCVIHGEAADVIERCRILCDLVTRIASVGVDKILAKDWSRCYPLIRKAEEQRDTLEKFSHPYSLCNLAIIDAREALEVIRSAL